MRTNYQKQIAETKANFPQNHDIIKTRELSLIDDELNCETNFSWMMHTKKSVEERREIKSFHYLSFILSTPFSV